MNEQTEGLYAGDIVHFEENARYSRGTRTVGASTTIEVGSVVQVSGANVAPLGAEDGDAAVAIALSRAETGVGESAEIVTLERHAIAKRDHLDFGAAEGSEIDDAIAALEARGILVNPSVYYSE